MTGGARRIGRVITAGLAAAGYDVAIHANSSADAAAALASELSRGGANAAVVVGDLRDPDAVARIVPEAKAALGDLSLLVNNASVFEEDTAATVTSASFRHHMAVHAEAPLLLSQAFADGAPRDSLIVNMIDQRVLKPNPRFVSYSASKATLWWLTRTLAQALAPRVRVMALGPGPILKSSRQTQEGFEALADMMPLRHAPNPQDFVRAILFFHATPSLTGQMLAVDAGQHLAWDTPDAVVDE